MGLCSCLASCSTWGIQHWSLLAVGWSWILVFRWRSLGELLLINITWGQDVSGGPTSWTQLSHLGGSGLTPSRSTKPLPATWHGRKHKNKQNQRDRTPKQMVKAKLSKHNHTKNHTHSQNEKKKGATKQVNKPTNENKH